MLADLKGGSGVRPFAGVPHVAQIITDLEGDQSLLGRFVDALEGELSRRKAFAICRCRRCNRVQQDSIAIRSSSGAAEVLPALPVLMVIIDEFAELYKLMGNEIHEVLDGSAGRDGRIGCICIWPARRSGPALKSCWRTWRIGLPCRRGHAQAATRAECRMR